MTASFLLIGWLVMICLLLRFLSIATDGD